MSITVVLTLYKRPHLLLEQIKSVMDQSVQPENIIVWKNTTEGVCLPEIPPDIKNKIIIIDSGKNFGVWARFYVGLLVNSTYVCVFDDDTIPGVDWFKNCLNTMETKCGLLGTIGLRFRSGYGYSNYQRVGWDGPSNEIIQVDIVGHAWFFKREWIHYLTEYNPDFNTMHRRGEDICFSYILQKHGINTYVPPHPPNCINMWGSNPHLAMLYGTDQNATNMIDGMAGFDNALTHFKELGFKILDEM